jgi:hypothetical protein
MNAELSECGGFLFSLRPRFHNVLFQPILAGFDPRGIMLFGNLDRSVPEENTNVFSGRSGFEQFDGKSIPKSMSVATRYSGSLE